MSEQSPNYFTQPNKGIDLKSLEIVWHDSLEEFMRAKWAEEIAAMVGGYDEWLQDHGYSSTKDAAGYIWGTGVGVFFDGNKLHGWLDLNISSEVAVYFLAHYISAHIESPTLDNMQLLFAEVALHAHRLALTHKQIKEVGDATHHLPQKKGSTQHGQ